MSDRSIPSHTPPTPVELADRLSLDDILDVVNASSLTIVSAVYGVDHLAPAELAAAVLNNLAHCHALADKVLRGRWCYVRDALVAGAEVADVATAMGLDVDEVVVGLRSWADGQRRFDLITEAQHAEVFAVLAAAIERGER